MESLENDLTSTAVCSGLFTGLMAFCVSAKLVGIDTFERRRDFIKASGIINTGFVAYILKSSSGNNAFGLATIPSVLVLSTFAILHATISGAGAYEFERVRRVTPFALRYDGTIGRDWTGDGTSIPQPAPDAAEKTYVVSCISTMGANLLATVTSAGVCFALTYATRQQSNS